jgi:hypothetical protein
MPNLIQVRRILSRGDIVETQTFSDDFNRADENLNANANWTLLAGTNTDLVIVSNAVTTGTTTASGTFAACPDCGSSNQFVSYTNIPTNVNRYGVFLCYVDGSNHIIGTLGGAVEYRVHVRVAGVSTQRISHATTVENGDVFKMRRFGSTISLFENGALVSTYTLTAGEITALTGGTRAGLRNGSVGNPSVDNFSHGTVT